MKETFWSKLRELWALRSRCKHIELQQRRNLFPRSTEFYAKRSKKLLVNRGTPSVQLPPIVRLDAATQLDRVDFKLNTAQAVKHGDTT
jgi:hypothetical protein